MPKQVRDDQRKLLRTSSRTLAIIGKLNPEETSLDKNTFVFSNQQTGEGIKRISAESFF